MKITFKFFTLKYLLFLLTVFFLCSGIIPAKEFTAAVRNTEKKFVPSVKVTVMGTGITTVTNQQGQFTLNLPEDSKFVTLVFRRSGFHAVEKRIKIDSLPGVFTLFFIPAENLLQRITVTPLNQDKKELLVPTAESSIPSIDMQVKMPENIIEGISDTLGVHFIGSGGYAVTPSIRGLARRRVLILVDGMRVTSDRRAGTSASFVPPDLTGRTEIIRSSSSVLYGTDAIGGVINIFTRGESKFNIPESEKNSFNIGTDSINKRINTGFTLQKRTEKWNFYSGFQYIDAGDYKAPDFTVNHSGYTYLSGIFDVTYRSNNRELYLGFIGGHGKNIGKPDRTNNPNKYSNVRKESDDFIRMGYRDNNIVKNGSFDISLYFNPSVYKLDKIDKSKNTLQQSDTTGLNFGIKSVVKKILNPNLSYQVGMEFFARRNIRMLNLDQSVSKTTVTLPMDNGTLNDYGMFLSMEYTGIPKVIIDGGIRYNFFSSKALVEGETLKRDSNAPSFFLGVTKKLSSSISLFASIGRAFRIPSLSETFYSGITGRSSVIGNPDLEPENSLNLDTGIKMVTSRFSAGVYLFSYHVNDMIERYFITSLNTYTYDNIIQGRIYGWEGELEYSPVTILTLWSNYFYYHGRSKTDDAALNDVPSSRISGGIKTNINRFLAEVSLFHSFKKKDPGPAEVENKAYNLLNFTGGYYLSSNISIFIRMSNILNETYYANADPDIPIAKGFEVSGGIHINF